MYTHTHTHTTIIKVVADPAMKAYCGSGGITLLFLNLGIKGDASSTSCHSYTRKVRELAGFR